MKTARDAFGVLCPLLVVSLAATSLDAQPTVTPAVDSWLLNLSGAKGTSPASNIDAIVSQFDADVQRIRHNGNDVYINATGIPSYAIGPWPDGNPDVAMNQRYLVRIPKVPNEQMGPKTATSLGTIGHWVNGVAIYNSWDGKCHDGASPLHRATGNETLPSSRWTARTTPTVTRLQLAAVNTTITLIRPGSGSS